MTLKQWISPALLFVFFMTTSAQAQLISNDSKEPVDITGDTAEFQDNVAVWTGNVRVVQGEAILTTKRLEAQLSEDGQFETITAIGLVRYSNGKEAITGERAVFNDVARTITITENVIVTQGKQVMSAGKITYWVDTGKILFTPEAGKRIRGLFFTGEQDEQI
ncbi:LptA/OstA family protein [Hyphococcus lacteus]|uniref:LptA/OstA family protein n=1 Tax=Hyphococcus lacteus TaxID=3143536 RepID=A0ABV3YZL0_9PROT